jgi:4-nitrophenyl phosphatase
MTHLIKSIQCLIFDMDGTIYLGSRLLPGAANSIHHLNEISFPYFFLTNNSSRSKEDYARKLTEMGLPTPEEKIITSGEATAIYLSKQNPGTKIFLVGTPSLEDEFRQNGFQLTEEDPAFVVLGFDTTLTYQKLVKLCNFVRDGIPYIATHPDINCPTEDGFIPDIGSIMALVKASTGRDPDVIVGKPYQPIVDAIAEKTGFSPTEMMIVGDRLYTDIALGKAGMRTALVLTGETHLEDLPSTPHQPDLILSDMFELFQLFGE